MISSTATGSSRSLDTGEPAGTTGTKRSKATPRNRRVSAAPKPTLGATVGVMATKVGRRIWRLLAVAVLAATIAVGSVTGWRFVTTNHRFAIRNIRFSRLSAVPESELAAALGPAEGQNIFRFDREAARDRMLSHPKIAAVTINRVLPATLQIETRERLPAVLVAAPDGLFLADAEGHVYDHATVEDSESLLVVTGLDVSEPGQESEVVRGYVREAIEVAAQWNLASISHRPALSEVAVHPSLGISLFLRDGGAEIRLGRGNLDQKLARFDALAKELEQRNETFRAIYLDADRTDRIAVKLQTQEPPSPVDEREKPEKTATPQKVTTEKIGPPPTKVKEIKGAGTHPRG